MEFEKEAVYMFSIFHNLSSCTFLVLLNKNALVVHLTALGSHLACVLGKITWQAIKPLFNFNSISLKGRDRRKERHKGIGEFSLCKGASQTR